MRIASLLVAVLLCQVAAAQQPVDLDWDRPLPADLEEGRAILGTLRDRTRVLYVQKGNKLPETMALKDLVEDKSMLVGKFYPGTVAIVVAGNSDNSYKGTYFLISSLKDVDAPSITLTFDSVGKGKSKLTADRQSPIVTEGNLLLGTLKDRLRVVCVRDGGLPAGMDFSSMGVSLGILKGKYFPGDVELIVRGDVKDGFKGTSITIYPLDNARAAKMSVTLTSVEEGTYDGFVVESSWSPRDSEGRRVLLSVSDALRSLYKKENRIPAKADLKTLDMTLDGLKGEHFAEEVIIKVKGDAKNAYRGAIVTARELGAGGGYMSIVFENGLNERGTVVMGDGSPDVTEGRALLETISTALKRKFVKNNKTLPEKVDLDWIGLPFSVLKKVHALKFYGDDIAFKVAGTADNDYKGTTITINPLKGVNAPVMVLTFESVSTGKFEIKVEE